MDMTAEKKTITYKIDKGVIVRIHWAPISKLPFTWLSSTTYRSLHYTNETVSNVQWR